MMHFTAPEFLACLAVGFVLLALAGFAGFVHGCLTGKDGDR
jgi:hypothetical protein